MRDVIVAANWKMHTTPADAGELARTIAARTREPGVTRVICPPFVCLAAVARRAGRRRSATSRSAPRTSTTSWPARTRARSPRRCSSGLATWVIVGHSERRRDAGETDAAHRPQARAGGRRRPAPDPVRRRAARRSARPAGPSRSSTASSAAPSPSHDAAALTTAGLVIAYEPVWAIGTGRNATGADAAAMADAIRTSLGGLGLGRRAPPASRSCTAAASPRPTSTSSWPSRRSTAPSSAARRSSPTRWPGSWPGPGMTARARGLAG